jgi:glucokinase
MALAVGVDVGGTKVAAGVVDESGQLLATTRRPTPSTSPPDTLDAIAEVVKELQLAHDV